MTSKKEMMKLINLNSKAIKREIIQIKLLRKIRNSRKSSFSLSNKTGAVLKIIFRGITKRDRHKIITGKRYTIQLDATSPHVTQIYTASREVYTHTRYSEIVA